MAQNQINFKIGFQTEQRGLQELQSILSGLQAKVNTLDPGSAINKSLQSAGQTASKLQDILTKSMNADLGTVNATKFSTELKKAGLTVQQLKLDLTKLGPEGATAFNQLSNGILNTNLKLKQSSQWLDKMANTMANTVRWSITSTIINTITGSIQKAVGYTEDLNTSLNDIRIVTEKSADSMTKFAKEANAAAKALGSSTLDYTEASLIYYQQGLSDSEAKARAETTIKAANVTGQSAQTVSEQLTAVWNGYKVSSQEAELYVDKLAAVAARTAADLEELSTGMSKVASAANSMGVDVDQLNAQLATIVSVTRQAPESVGTALKTIYARMGDLKVDGQDEFGVSLGEVSGTLESLGIDILEMNGELRDMGEVMTEVGEKWNTWNDAQQQAIAISMAGKRQYNNLIALFENWDMYSDSLETSANSMGTLQKQQDIYMQSTEAKLKTLKSTWEDLYSGLILDDEKNYGIEALTNLVETFDKFIDSFGGGVKTITAFGAIVSGIFHRQIGGAITRSLTNFETYRENLNAIQLKKDFAYNTAQMNSGQITMEGKAAEAAANTIEPFAQRISSLGAAGLGVNEYNELIDLQIRLTQLKEDEVLSIEKAKQALAEQVQDEQTVLEIEKIIADTSNKTTHEQMDALGKYIEQKIIASEESLEIAQKELEIQQTIEALQRTDTSRSTKEQAQYLYTSTKGQLTEAEEAELDEILSGQLAKEYSNKALNEVQNKLTNSLSKQKQLATDTAEAAKKNLDIAQERLKVAREEAKTKQTAYDQENAKLKQLQTYYQKINGYSTTNIGKQRADTLLTMNKQLGEPILNNDQQALLLKVQSGAKLNETETAALQQLQESIKKTLYDQIQAQQTRVDLTGQEHQAAQAVLKTREQEVVRLKQSYTEAIKLQEDLERRSQALINSQNLDTVGRAKALKKAGGNLLEAEDQQLLDEIIQGTIEHTEVATHLEELYGKITERLQEQLQIQGKTTEERQKEVQAAEQALQEQKKAMDAAKKRVKTQEEINRKIAEGKTEAGKLESALENASRKVDYQGVVTGITSTLSAASSLWMQMSSLSEIWTDEDVEIGDKLAQTFMTLSFTLPMILSSISNLNKAFGFTTGIIETLTIKKQLNNSLDAAGIVLSKKATAEETVRAIANKVSTETEHSRNVQLTLSKATLTEAIVILSKLNAEELEAIGLDSTHIAVLKAKKQAQDAANTSMLASPIGWIVAAIGALIAVITIVINLQKKAQEEREEAAKKAVEAAEKAVEAAEKEREAIEELATAYEKLADSYKNNDLSLESLRASTHALLLEYGDMDLAIKALSADYEGLNDLIRESEIRAQKKVVNEKQGEIQDKIEQILIDNFKDLDKNNKISELVLKSNLEEDSFNTQVADLFNKYELGDGIIKTKGTGIQSQYNKYTLNNDAIIKFLTMDIESQNAFIKDIENIANQINKEYEEQYGYEYGNLADNWIYYLQTLQKQSKEEFLPIYNELISDQKELINLQTYKGTEIIDVQSYKNEIEDLKNAYLKEGLTANPEEANEWAQSYLAGFDELKDIIYEANIQLAIDTKIQNQDLLDWLKDKDTETKVNVLEIGSDTISTEYAEAHDNLVAAQNRQSLQPLITDIINQVNEGKEISNEDLNSLLSVLTDEQKKEIDGKTGRELSAALNRIAVQSAMTSTTDASGNLVNIYKDAYEKQQEDYKTLLNSSIDNVSEGLVNAYRTLISDPNANLNSNQDILNFYEELQKALNIKIANDDLDEKDIASINQVLQLFGTNEFFEKALELLGGFGEKLPEGINISSLLFAQDFNQGMGKGQGTVTAELDINVNTANLDLAKSKTLELTSTLGYYKKALEVVDDGLLVSQENVEIIAANMPELLKGATDAGNGAIKLNADVYNNAINQVESYSTTIQNKINEYTNAMNIAYDAGEDALGSEYAIIVSILAEYKNWINNADALVDTTKELYNELDNIEKQIDILDRKFERLSASLDKMSGAAFKANYKSVNASLEERLKLYQDLQKFTAEEMRRQQVTLLEYGFEFSDEGLVTNVSEVLNNISDENIRKDAEETVELYYDLFGRFYDAQDRRIEIMNQQIENELKAFNIDIEITTNIDEVNDAILELNKILLDDDDIIGLTTANVSSLGEKYSTLNSKSTNIQNIRNEIEKINNGEESVYSYIDPATGARVNDPVAAYEALKENTDSMVSTLGSIKDLSQEINESYIDLLDQAQEQFDAYINSLEQLDGFLNHRLQVIELLQGEEAYDSFDNIYNLQKQNLLQEKKSYEDQMAFYEARIEETKGVNEEAYKEAISKWQEAASGWQNVVEASIEVIQNDYSNAIKNIFKSLENELSNNLGFKAISEEWESIKSDSKEYLDTVNRAYEIEKISMKFRKAIDQTDNIKAQAKLQKTMEDEEMALLEKKDKLSQYDVDRADLKYQITLKQLALEDQMQAKTKMRLTRDANGGYSYKFVADESATENLESEILDLENQLYNLDKDKYEKNLDSIYALYQEFAEKVQEVLNDNSLTEEEKQTKLYNLRNEYQDKFIIKAKENTDIQKNLIDSVGYTMDDLMSTTGKDIETILKESIPGLTSGMQGMANRLTEDGGFYSILDNAFIELEKACTDFARELEALELDTTYNNIATNIANIINATDPMLTAIDEQFKALEPLLKRVQEIESAWAGALANAKELARESYEAYKNGINNPPPGTNGNGIIQDPLLLKINTPRWTDYSQIDKEIADKYNIMSEEKFNKNKISGDVTGSNIDKASINEANQYYNYQAYLDDKYYQVMNKSSIDDRGNETLSYDASLILTESSKIPGNADYFEFNNRIWTTTPGVGKHPVFQEMKPTKNTARFAPEAYVKAKTTSSGYTPVAYYATRDAWLFNANKLEGTVFQILDPTIYENGHDKYVKAQLIQYGEQAHNSKFEASPIYLPISGLETIKNTNLDPKFFQKYDTGGYTGAWGSSEGRMAMLHEKELVLNKMDTANILSAVSMVRDIASALTASVNLHIADKMSRILSASDFEQAETTPMEQNVHIEAHFPNVNNSKEIEEAFDNLVLRATQAALKNPFR